MSDRQKLFFALVVSALVHVVIGLVLAISRIQRADDTASARPDLSQLEVTIMPPSAVAPTPPPAPALLQTIPPSQKRPVMDSDGLTQSKVKPARPKFQSDADMVAASRVPALGSEPLPSVEGPKRDFTEFANQAASMGKGESAAEAQKNPARRAVPSLPQPPIQALAQQTNRPPATPVPTPKPAPSARPVPTAKPTPTPGPNSIALGKPTPTPVPPVPPAFKQPTPVAVLARLTTPPMRVDPQLAPAPQRPADQSAPPAPDAGTRRETDKTRVEGNITNVGDPGVDAEKTPYAQYYHKVNSLIGSRWILYTKEHGNDIGSVKIWFKLNKNGKVVSEKVIENHSVDNLAEVSINAIVESQLPPVPADLAPFLNNEGYMEMTFSFEVYGPNDSSR